MRSAILTGLLLLAMAFSISAQNSAPSSSSTATTAAPTSQSDVYVRPDAKTRQKRYVSSIFGPYSLAKTVALAGITTARNSPEEWGPHWDGFGRRLASGFSRGVIKNSIQFGLDEALKVDSHFYRSKDKSVGARIGNALISPVTARTTEGKRTIGIPRIVGTYASSIIAEEAWFPARYDWKDGVKAGTISLGFSAAFNVFEEFLWKK